MNDNLHTVTDADNDLKTRVVEGDLERWPRIEAKEEQRRGNRKNETGEERIERKGNA